MRYVYTILALILIGLLIYVLWPRERSESTADLVMVKSLQAKYDKAEAAKAAVIAMARKDSADHAAVTKAKDAEIARLKVASRKYRQANVRIDTVLLNEPEVGNYAAFLDSIVVAQDSQIAELKEQNAVTWRNFNQVIAQSDSVNTANINLNNYYLETERKANKQLRRQNKNLKIACVAIPVGIVALVLIK